jgi:phosphatidylglycerophosphate synthase
MFQTLDGIDGKHARRTGTSSPLGQIFDHGGDSISTIFLLIGISHAVKMEKDNLITLFIGA